MATRILIVDDEPPIIDVLEYNLKKANYEVIVARDGQEALDKARRQQPDLVILDLMLPKLDGLEVCRALRRDSDLPIIMLTAKDEEIDRVVGLELGADDYVVKPFSVRELVARVKTVLRRSGPKPLETEPEAVSEVLQVGDLRLDAARHEVHLGSTELELTTLEFDLLHVLMAHADRVLTREQLLDQVWGYDYYGDTRTVDTAVKRLRAKLRRLAPDSEFIVTVRGVGYKLQEP
ncbi:MAG: response regulator transcription factor [Anaerolineales bacterium]|nr:MAG: response regulator transcription factor [Anaerolineales bacterium]